MSLHLTNQAARTWYAMVVHLSDIILACPNLGTCLIMVNLIMRGDHRSTATYTVQGTAWKPS